MKYVEGGVLYSLSFHSNTTGYYEEISAVGNKKVLSCSSIERNISYGLWRFQWIALSLITI